MLRAWRQVSGMLQAGEISQEDYDCWRYHYPKFDNTQNWVNVPPQALSDTRVKTCDEKSEK